MSLTVNTESGLVFDDGDIRLYHANSYSIPLAKKSVHCAVTSPPYWKQRVYQDVEPVTWASGWTGLLGNEPTPDQYIGHLLEIFSEVWRVLRDDGVLWVNLGDTRGGSSGSNHSDNQALSKSKTQSGANGHSQPFLNRLAIPERFALAMQQDGWIWRDTIIWAKKTTMPESVSGTRWERCRVKVRGSERSLGPNPDRNDGGRSIGGIPYAQWTDCPGCAKCGYTDGLVLHKGSWRCTSSYEYIYMFVKSDGYYWSDGEDVRTPYVIDGRQKTTVQAGEGSIQHRDGERWPGTGANLRNVWTDISPEPYLGKHFATFPSDLSRKCILASTSAKGCCSRCGAQWARVIERTVSSSIDCPKTETAHHARGGIGKSTGTMGQSGGSRVDAISNTIDWRPTCACNPVRPIIPSTVLDPFAGTATTCIAAYQLARQSIGIEASESYLNQAVRRIATHR